MTNARAQRYALAGATAVTVGELLRHVHAARRIAIAQHAGWSQDSVGPSLTAALAAAFGAAAASSALVTRLLIGERDAVRADLELDDRPLWTEPGVTVLDASRGDAQSAIVRAMAAAEVEIVSARQAWRDQPVAVAKEVVDDLASLFGYVEQLANLVDSTAATEEDHKVSGAEAEVD